MKLYHYDTSNPHACVRAFAIARLIGQIPTPSQVNWASSQAPEFDSPDYWVPYGVWRGAAYIKPWATGLLNYIATRTLTADEILRAFKNPLAIYEGIANDLAPVPALIGAAHGAEDMTNPETAKNNGYDEWAEKLDLIYGQVMLGMTNGNIVIDARRIKRMLRAKA